ncbi:MAG: hypothetical protein MUE44_06025 [Oscillatoriaceae cyanobacterium Prado104]|nr:hypothetical protein [Oscillatoriaceae cyanobacterium Prado104]
MPKCEPMQVRSTQVRSTVFLSRSGSQPQLLIIRKLTGFDRNINDRGRSLTISLYLAGFCVINIKFDRAVSLAELSAIEGDRLQLLRSLSAWRARHRPYKRVGKS